LARFQASGRLDPAFGGNGIVTTSFGTGYSGLANDVKIDGSGRIVAAGAVITNSNYKRNFLLIRYLPNGELDRDFDGNGMARTVFEDSSEVYALAFDPQKRIIAAGRANSQFALVRYLENGSRDPSFGNNGKVVTTIGNPDEESIAYALTRDSQNRLVAVGTVYEPVVE
jgi:uncharacterized delta-60 repeat protein